MDLSAMDLSTAGMAVERRRMDLIAANLANVDTTSVREEQVRGAAGDLYVRHTPYRRRTAIILSGPGGQPRLSEAPDLSPFRAEHRPEHPHAVPQGTGEADAGTVYLPNVNPLIEMADMMAASRAYEANVTAIEVEKAMLQNGLRILG